MGPGVVYGELLDCAAQGRRVNTGAWRRVLVACCSARGDGEEIALHRPAVAARAATAQLVARCEA
eukprot:scaffold23702_cov105-Phaeocystis_antarctica.AAC.2